jgi:hypothetical protein
MKDHQNRAIKYEHKHDFDMLDLIERKVEFRTNQETLTYSQLDDIEI